MRNRPQSPKLIKKPGVILWHTQIIPIPGGRDRKISGTSWPTRLSQFMTSNPNERASFIKLSDSNFDEHPRLTSSLHMLTHTHEHAPTHKCAHMNTCVHENTHTHTCKSYFIPTTSLIQSTKCLYFWVRARLQVKNELQYLR